MEIQGHALFDLVPERRGNIFSDEVYRLTKAKDATTVNTYSNNNNVTDSGSQYSNNDNQYFDLPSSHQFTSNDVIMLTLQPAGSGDFFGSHTLPTNSDSINVEARVLNTGPHYIDIACAGGVFESAFGSSTSSDDNSNKNNSLRLRADRFFSDIPYKRMVSAIGEITSVTQNKQVTPKQNIQSQQQEQKDGSNTKNSDSHKNKNKSKGYKQTSEIHMDPLFRDLFTSTFSFASTSDAETTQEDEYKLSELSKLIAKPPHPNSNKLANQVIDFMTVMNPDNSFPPYNGPQVSAIKAALTRRFTMIQGPPGTGKTTVASAIGVGFVHQSRQISPHAKVLATAFSNVGADNLAESLLKMGLKVCLSV